MIIVFIIGFITGVVIDNRFAPKVRVVDGKITFEWNTKKL